MSGGSFKLDFDRRLVTCADPVAAQQLHARGGCEEKTIANNLGLTRQFSDAGFLDGQQLSRGVQFKESLAIKRSRMVHPP